MVILFTWTQVQAREEILEFHSEIVVYENAEMRVTESIKVNAEGKQIKRGIYRDFPTTYKDRFNNRYNVGFYIEGVLRNEKNENYHTSTLSNGIRIYFGQKDRYLKTGEHRYSLRYLTNRQLGFFDDHDELYWNVTGNDWAFPINKASALIRLPDNIPADQIRVEAYTGSQGAKGQDYRAEVRGNGIAWFETTKPLPARHGLTIVVSFPKGYIAEPTREEKLLYLIDDNKQLLYGGIGLLIVLIYYWLAWLRVGNDPEAGVIIANYTPPKGYSPASMRYIEKMGYDNTCFAVALVNLSVKGYLKISELYDKKYRLEKTGMKVKMAPGESALVKALFTSSSQEITMEQSNHSRFRAAKSAHEASLKQDYEKIYFLTNTRYFVVGILLTIIVLVISFIASESSGEPAALFLLVWLTGWTFGVIALLKSALLQWCNIKENLLHIIPAIFITCFAFPFIAAEIFVIYQLSQLTSHTMVFMILLTILINWLFYELLKAPTLAGRELLDRIEGFRRYIEVAERIELESRYAPKKTPELFEEYLPYAMALGMELEWGNIFAGAFRDLEQQGNQYDPAWYHGSRWNSHNLGDFTSSVSSSLTSAVSSSSTAPGSSSGGGGGGSSGGGGGGGGGW